MKISADGHEEDPVLILSNQIVSVFFSEFYVYSNRVKYYPKGSLQQDFTTWQSCFLFELLRENFYGFDCPFSSSLY